MELLTMLSFCAVLLLCVVMKWSVLYALVAGVPARIVGKVDEKGNIIRK